MDQDPALVIFFILLVIGLFVLIMQPKRHAPTVFYVPVETEQQRYGNGCLLLLLILIMAVVVLFAGV